jgi:hypothetical protein
MDVFGANFKKVKVLNNTNLSKKHKRDDCTMSSPRAVIAKAVKQSAHIVQLVIDYFALLVMTSNCLVLLFFST